MLVDLPCGILSLKVQQAQLPLEELCDYASRQNPKRGFLFVSKVLGRYVPTEPRAMAHVYQMLYANMVPHIEGQALFLGFAEASTGLGMGVFEQWARARSGMYIHTTRYLFDHEILFRFEEEHSHATQHLIYRPKGQFHLDHYNTLVIIDDEITTGKTAMNFLEQFLALKDCKAKRVVVMSIKNWMSPVHRQKFKARFKHHDIQFVSILDGSYEFMADPQYVCQPMPNVEATKLYKDRVAHGNYGRFGISRIPSYDYSPLLAQCKGKKVLVVGTGEFSFMPYKLAQFLENSGVDVVYQSTTRSPVLLGHAIKQKLTFKDNYGDNIDNFLYNVAPGQYDQIYIAMDTVDNFDFTLHHQLQAKLVLFKDLQPL